MPARPGGAHVDQRGWIVPLKGYGALRGKAVDRRREGSSDSPRFRVRVVDGDGVDFRIAVSPGWHDLSSVPGEASLDDGRGNLFDAAR